MWQSLVAVAGTLAGVLLTSLIQRTERTAAAKEARRREALAAVSDLGTALETARTRALTAANQVTTDAGRLLAA
ncbi:hypothetical protein ACIRP2_37255 [Streptomyces sp. NPDC101194]|uniref:hypothetical protein n=1 Tax=Streptomyces sp. NPDC101194 TaxID=3366127 RepID=UPI00381B1358